MCCVAGKHVVVDAALVREGADDGEYSRMSESSSHRVLPLDAVQSLLVPECKAQLDIPDCAWETIRQCITEATVRLAFESANVAAQGKRKVITAEDVNRAIDGLHEKDPGLGMVIQEMDEVVTANKRAAEARRPRERRFRNNAPTAEKMAKEQEEGPSGRCSGH
jgi:histone H3/H4